MSTLPLIDAAPLAVGAPAPAPVATGPLVVPSPELDLFVSGTALPKGSKTAIKRGDKVIQIEDVDLNHNGALTAWSNTVATAARTSWGPRAALDESVHVVLEFYRARPGGVRRWQSYASTKPDADKLVRCIGDALQKAGVVRDDSRIADLRAIKRYCEGAETPGVRIRVWALGGWERTGWTVEVPAAPVLVRKDGAA